MKKIDSYGKILRKLILLLIILFPTVIFSQTGKIAGRIIDKKTGDPIIGANVLIENTNWGAATDIDGNFSIINLPPGKYDILIRMLGYEKLKVQGVSVSINRTTSLSLQLQEEGIALDQEVVVVASKVSMKKDQTGSIKNVGKEEIEALPVESLGDVVNLQSGVVKGHFRGGRADEVSYMVDGLVVDDSYGKTSANAGVETDVIEEVEVITGAFNAEYGNAMSGVVNVVTKDGSNDFKGSVSINSSNYLTSHKDVFIGLKDNEFDRNTDYRLFLSGPIVKNYLTFVANVRYQDRKNWLNGIRRFMTNDYSIFETADEKDKWYSEHSGDNSYVPMNDNENYSIFSKVTFKPFAGLRSSFSFTKNHSRSRSYAHIYKYNPDGRAYLNYNSELYSLNINHSLSKTLFYELKASYLHNYRGYYAYEDPTDPRYVHRFYSRNDPGFYTGGQEKDHSIQKTNDLNLKFDLTWQLNKNHIMKTGLLYKRHDLDIQNSYVRNSLNGTGIEDFFYFDTTRNKYIFPNFKPELTPDSSVSADIYNVKPIEFAWYVQDKMEYDNMVINLGVRLEYFDPNTTYPSNWRNPSNAIRFDENNKDKMSTYPKADTHLNLSPRLGVAYQLSDAALLRFAYAHTLQMPPLYALYQNHSYLVPPNDFGTLMGNPNLKPQKTVQYEVGLWQQLSEGMGIEVAVYYRDIYDLLGTKVISTYNQVEYGLYTNLDYGNAKGLELKFDYVKDNLSFYLNYTLQYTRGNADNPTQAFNRAGSNIDPVNKLIRMPWDQRHTLNASLGYNTEKYGATLTGYYNSGTPYTWTPIPESPLSRINLDPYNSIQPSQFNCDLRAFWNFYKNEYFSMKLNLLVYNLFDSLLENSVYSQTGRAYNDIIRDETWAAHRSDFNKADDVVKNPAMYGAPREVKIGLDVSF